MIKRIWKVIVLFGSMLLICGCGKEKLSEEDILQKINTTGECADCHPKRPSVPCSAVSV